MAVTHKKDFVDILRKQKLVKAAFVALPIPFYEKSFHFPLTVIFTASGSPNKAIRNEKKGVIENAGEEVPTRMLRSY